MALKKSPATWARRARRAITVLSAIALAVYVMTETPAMEASDDGSFTVGVTVQASCMISASPLAFGVYTGAVSSTTAAISVTCTRTTPYNVGLDAGLAAGATVTTRRMQYQANTLAYALYSNAAMTTNWGQTVGSDTVTGSGSGGAQTLTVYGRMAGGSYVAPGAYADTITATVSY